ncbi:MAG: hypothetical protein QXJ51_04115 [Sulfolobales archaeon]
MSQASQETSGSELYHSLRILSQLSCLPQVRRYEYYISRGEIEKARSYIENVMKDLIRSRESIEKILYRSRELANMLRKTGSGEISGRASEILKTVPEFLRELENLPENVRGCLNIKAHVESVLYTISNIAERISRGFLLDKSYEEELLRNLEYLSRYLEEILKII